MGNVYVLGSINYDIVTTCKRLPVQGETINGSEFFCNSGGKGANQAVAAQKAGAVTFLLGGVGNDDFGKVCLDTISNYGVNTKFVQKTGGNTGSAVIIINNNDNRIIINSGANSAFDKEKMLSVIKDNIKPNDIFAVQLEIPLSYVEEGLEIAKMCGATTILNPAPAVKLSDKILENTDIIVPNETEAMILTGTENYKKACEIINVNNIIVTLGAKGCYYNGKVYPAKNSTPLDTTAAGDTFIGVLAACLSKGKSIEESIEYCQCACSITIERKGAQISIPTAEEIEMRFKEEK